MKDGRTATQTTDLEGPLNPMLCVPGHPDAVPVHIDNATKLRQEVNDAYVSLAESGEVDAAQAVRG